MTRGEAIKQFLWKSILPVSRYADGLHLQICLYKGWNT